MVFVRVLAELEVNKVILTHHSMPKQIRLFSGCHFSFLSGTCKKGWLEHASTAAAPLTLFSSASFPNEQDF